jgi:hypothetical protein
MPRAALAFERVTVLAAAVVALAALTAGDDPGFGGGGTEEAAAPADDVCTVKGDDGVWRSCEDAIALKQKAKAAPEEPVVDMSPAAVALRKQAAEAEAAARAAEAAAARPKTKLEQELEKARIDMSLPLLQVRIAVARAQQDIDDLEKKGVGGDRKEAAVAALAEAQSVDDDVERIALHRMDVCLQRRGKKSIIKNYRMTAAGPVLLTVGEMMRLLPIVDPVGCERVYAVDKDVVARVVRVHELKKILAATDFGYARVDERKKLEKELADVEALLAKDATPALSAPGVRDHK